MFEYKCLQEYASNMETELNKLTRKGWELVGQPVVNDSGIFFATMRKEVTKH